MSSVRGFLRTSSQFVYVVAILVAAPSLALLAWGFLDTARFLSGTVLDLALGKVAAAAAGGTAVASAVAFLRPDDMAPWMLPLAGVLLLVFSGLMVLLFVLPR